MRRGIDRPVKTWPPAPVDGILAGAVGHRTWSAWGDDVVAATGQVEVVGRRRELERLRAVLSDVTVVRPAAVVVSGEAGIGKTTLLDRFLHGVEATVLTGTC